MKVLVIGQGNDTCTWLLKIANVIYAENAKVVLDNINVFLNNIDGVVFTGGADVPPDMYRQHRHPKTYSALGASREQHEQELFYECIAKDIPCVGICRGSQFLAVMNGGSLYQDLFGHTTVHDISTCRGEVYRATSTHHQMFNFDGYEDKADVRMIAWAKNVARSVESMTETDKKEDRVQHRVINVEPEIYQFLKLKCLCIQGHPEFQDADSKYSEYCLTLVERLLTGKHLVAGA